MFFKKNTLSEIDTVRAVTAVALISLKRYFEGSTALSAGERNKLGSMTIARLGAQTSFYHQAKLMAFVDKLTTTVINTPTFHDFYRNSILDGSKASIDEAREELSVLAFHGLLENKIIAGVTIDQWSGSDRVNNIVQEFEEYDNQAIKENSKEVEDDVVQEELVQTANNILCGLMDLQLSLLSELNEVNDHKFTIGYLSGITNGYTKTKGLDEGCCEERTIFESCVKRLFGEEYLSLYCEHIYEKTRKLKDIRNGRRVGQEEIIDFLKYQNPVMGLADFFHEKADLESKKFEEKRSRKNKEQAAKEDLRTTEKEIKKDYEPKATTENKFLNFTSFLISALIGIGSLLSIFSQLKSLIGGETSDNFRTFSNLPDATTPIHVLYALTFEKALAVSVFLFVFLMSVFVLMRFNRALYSLIVIGVLSSFVGHVSQSGLNIALNRGITYNYHIHSKSLLFFVFWGVVTIILFMTAKRRKHDPDKINIAPIKCTVAFVATLISIFLLILFSGMISPLSV